MTATTTAAITIATASPTCNANELNFPLLWLEHATKAECYSKLEGRAMPLVLTVHQASAAIRSNTALFRVWTTITVRVEPVRQRIQP